MAQITGIDFLQVGYKLFLMIIVFLQLISHSSLELLAALEQKHEIKYLNFYPIIINDGYHLRLKFYYVQFVVVEEVFLYAEGSVSFF